MTDPIVADIKPAGVTVEAEGKYHWCRCGRSKKQPYCDGSHRGTGLEPQSFSADSDGKVYLCQCKQTRNPPYCDGSHKTLKSTDIGKEMKPEAGDRPKAEPTAEEPTLKLDIPIFVSDMSFGALSEEAKIALATGAERAGTGICSGEGGMLPEEQQANSRYFYELASARFGYREELLRRVQAFHFKGGQGAKTGTGGHLPGNKVTGKIAEVRQLPEGTPAVSPPTFADLHTPADFRDFSDRVREISGGIPVGFKLSANHIEADIDFAIEAGADYIILDGRGGGTGAAPLIFRDNISVPTIPALARARRHLDACDRKNVTLIITGGLRTPADFIKALCLGADGVAVSNAAMQAIGCVAARICNTNNCPAGIATQDPELRKRMNVETGAERLSNFFLATVELMQVMARACGHSHLSQFNVDDLTTWKKDMAELSGVRYSGVG